MEIDILISALVLLLKEELIKLHLHWKQETDDLFEIYIKEHIPNLPENVDRKLLIKDLAQAIRDRQVERLSRTDSLSSVNLGELLKEDIPLQDNPRSTEDILDELENLEGLSRVKHRIRNIAQAIEMQKFREKKGMSGDPLEVHLILKGASYEKRMLTVRLLGELFSSMGYLSCAGFTDFRPVRSETSTAGDFVLSIRESFGRALGSILLVDADMIVQGDAAVLANGLAEQASVHRGKLTIILCGEETAIEKLLEMSPALKGCFSFTLDFVPY
ncbi:MAG: hypothetical protein LBQ88_13210 [Treponema sp.]|jgi:hypothetical protein|nr:hypothetical protein [Treponema sp.]